MTTKEEMEKDIGKRVSIRGNHPHAGREGKIDRVEVAGLLGKPGWIVDLDYEHTGRPSESCFVFERRLLKFL